VKSPSIVTWYVGEVESEPLGVALDEPHPIRSPLAATATAVAKQILLARFPPKRLTIHSDDMYLSPLVVF
jgi:hypothetical protein